MKEGVALALVLCLGGCLPGTSSRPGNSGVVPDTGQPIVTDVARVDTFSGSAEAARFPVDRSDGSPTFAYVCAPGEGAPDRGVPDEGQAGAGITFVVRIEGEAAWLFLPGQTVSLPRVVSASGARYSDGQTLLWSRGEEALLRWQGGEYRGCRNDRRAAIWEHAKLNGVDFRAVGQEPGWHLEIRRADSLVLVSDYGSAIYTFPWSEPVGEAAVPRTTYALQAGQDALKVVLELGPCFDTMSGEQFETEVTLWFNGRLLKGCGRALH